MTKKEATRRQIIMIILFWLGMLLCLCSVGRLDYLDEQHITCGIKELWIALGKGVGGLTLMMAGAFVGRNLEFEDESEEIDDDRNDL